MSAMIDSPVRYVNRQRTHTLRPEPEPSRTAAAPLWANEAAWDEHGWDEEDDDAGSGSGSGSAVVAAVYDPPEPLGPIHAPTHAPAPALPKPVVDVPAVPAARSRSSAPPCDGPAVPPRRTVALFPPIRAGRGRHRLPSAVRRRPGPIAAGLMVAATTLAAGTLRITLPPAGTTAAGPGNLCGPLRPGEPCG